MIRHVTGMENLGVEPDEWLTHWEWSSEDPSVSFGCNESDAFLFNSEDDAAKAAQFFRAGGVTVKVLKRD